MRPSNVNQRIILVSSGLGYGGAEANGTPFSIKTSQVSWEER